MTEGKNVRVVQIAPGLYVDRSKHPAIPRSNWLHLDDAGYRSLGLSREHRNTVDRLYLAGKIRLARIRPRVTLLDMDSWKKHIEECVADPWYWDRPENLRAYRGRSAKVTK